MFTPLPVGDSVPRELIEGPFTMRAVIATFLSAIACIFPGKNPSHAQPAPAIEWRLENNFRLFKRAEDTERLRSAFRALAAQLGRQPTILEFEQKLATDSEGWGWAEALVGNVVEDACWYRRDATCTSYARPTLHRVMVRIPDRSGECTWQLDGKPATTAPSPCASATVIEVPYPAGAEVAAFVDGAQIASTRIEVKDRLIVGLGDSFASGEGNPDRAVRFQPGRVVRYGASDVRLRGYPARVGDWRNTSDGAFADGDAQWLHRPCHRSLYSTHARVALHLALSDEAQQTSITFLSVACTAAEIENGLFNPAMGNDRPSAEEHVTLAQLSGISRAICAPDTTTLATESYTLRAIEGAPNRTRTHRIFACAKENARPIDLLLLSIGGNDIGFSKLVAWTILSDAAEGALKGSLTRDPAQARPYLPSLRHNYGEVNKAITGALHVDPRRVVLTAYPRMGFDELGAPCRSGQDGMEVSPLLKLYGRRAENVERFAENELTPLMREASAAHGWTWVESHREAARQHGFCAKGGTAGTAAAAGELAFPTRVGARQAAPDGGPRFVAASSTGTSQKRPAPKTLPREGGARAAGWLETAPLGSKWMPYLPSEYRPYLPRARWFRSPNDAFLTVNLHYGTVGDRVSLTQFVASSGAFHPNALGHAATADALHNAIVKSKLLD
jgi:hypothetical protein